MQKNDTKHKSFPHLRFELPTIQKRNIKKRILLSTVFPWLLGAALLLTGCQQETAESGEQESGDKSDIILISIDTLRADHLGCYGHAVAQTPNMDKLAAEGTLFETALTTVPITLPAHSSLLTALNPPRHQVRDNGFDQLAGSIETLAEVLQNHGYQTGAFIGAEPLNKGRGLAQGFDVYDYREEARAIGRGSSVKRPERYAKEVAASAAAWIGKADPNKPLFAFVHLFDPHSPYEKALPGQEVPSYDGEVAYVDRVIGQLLKITGNDRDLSNRLVVITSDHGEGLGEHSEQTHCIFVYDSTLRIPLIVHGTDRVQAQRIDEPVSIIDVAPTVLELVGIEGLDAGDGVSLAGLMQGRSANNRDLYFESLYGELRFGWAPLRGIRRGNLKFIDAPKPELYDLAVDPGELNNLFDKDDDAAVSDFRDTLADIGEGARTTGAIDEEAVRKLATLGYVTARPVDTEDDKPRADPKDRIEVYDRFQSVYQKFFDGARDEALELMSGLEPYMSSSPHFYVEWGFFQVKAGKWRSAIASYTRCLELSPEHQEARLNLGVSQIQIAKHADAKKNFDLLLAQNPDHAKAHLYAGVCTKELGDIESTEMHWRKFVDLAPHHPEAEKIRRALNGIR